MTDYQNRRHARKLKAIQARDKLQRECEQLEKRVSNLNEDIHNLTKEINAVLTRGKKRKNLVNGRKELLADKSDLEDQLKETQAAHSAAQFSTGDSGWLYIPPGIWVSRIHR
jgi:seryl-tRNA synthetase